MNKYWWLLVLPYTVNVSSDCIKHKKLGTQIGEMLILECEEYGNKYMLYKGAESMWWSCADEDTCLDIAEALNAAHERRMAPIVFYYGDPVIRDYRCLSGDEPLRFVPCKEKQ